MRGNAAICSAKPRKWALRPMPRGSAPTSCRPLRAGDETQTHRVRPRIPPRCQAPRSDRFASRRRGTPDRFPVRAVSGFAATTSSITAATQAASRTRTAIKSLWRCFGESCTSRPLGGTNQAKKYERSGFLSVRCPTKLAGWFRESGRAPRSVGACRKPAKSDCGPSGRRARCRPRWKRVRPQSENRGRWGALSLYRLGPVPHYPNPETQSMDSCPQAQCPEGQYPAWSSPSNLAPSCEMSMCHFAGSVVAGVNTDTSGPRKLPEEYRLTTARAEGASARRTGRALSMIAPGPKN